MGWDSFLSKWLGDTRLGKEQSVRRSGDEGLLFTKWTEEIQEENEEKQGKRGWSLKEVLEPKSRLMNLIRIRVARHSRDKWVTHSFPFLLSISTSESTCQNTSYTRSMNDDIQEKYRKSSETAGPGDKRPERFGIEIRVETKETVWITRHTHYATVRAFTFDFRFQKQ